MTRIPIKNIVKTGVPMPGNSGPKGKGKIQRLLMRMKLGQCIWGVNFYRSQQIRVCARGLGIGIAARQIPGSFSPEGKQLYAVWKTTP